MQQNDSNRTGHRQQNNNLGNVQNSKNAIYNTDNFVFTGLTYANLKRKKLVCVMNSVGGNALQVTGVTY